MCAIRNLSPFTHIFVIKEDMYTKLSVYFNLKRKICIVQKRLSSEGLSPHSTDGDVDKLRKFLISKWE